MLMKFFFMLIGVDQNNIFAGIIYALTVFPLYPFNGIVPDTRLGNGGAFIEWSTLIAMVIYFLVFWGAQKVVAHNDIITQIN